jgi:glyoxylase-like metal-dependent hydrolase (beta-lactamase superfamily II)
LIIEGFHDGLTFSNVARLELINGVMGSAVGKGYKVPASQPSVKTPSYRPLLQGKRGQSWENHPMALLVDRVIAPYYQTNCWIIAPGRGHPCVVVDPGIDIPNINRQLQEKLDQHQLTIGAVLITHGHLDHTFSLISAVDDFVEVDCFVHEADRDLLQFPERAMGEQSKALVQELKNSTGGAMDFAEPARTWSIQEDGEMKLGEMKFRMIHAPGHTPGSLVAQVNDELLVSGDVLFKGSIGRTDLPRGSMRDMESTLREKIATLSEDLRVLPGHGDETVMKQELHSNTYLRAAMEGRLQ